MVHSLCVMSDMELALYRQRLLLLSNIAWAAMDAKHGTAV